MCLPVSAAENSQGWEHTITFSGNGMNPVLYFGEKADASDGLDQYDVPMPPCPPNPYLYAFLFCGLPVPYNKLMYDIKYYPDTDKLWNIAIKSSDICTVKVSWEKIKDTEYKSVLLRDMETGNIIDMTKKTSYEFEIGTGYYYFQIFCSNTLLHSSRQKVKL